MPAILSGNLAGIFVVLLLFRTQAPTWATLLWLVPASVGWSLRLWLYRSFLNTKTETLAQWRRWRRLWNYGTLFSAAMWGLAAWLFYPYGDSNQRTALVIVVYTFCVAVVPVLASQPRVYLLFGALCFLPMASRVALVGNSYGLQLAGILLLIFSMTALLARNYRQALQRAIDLKVHADELAVQLRGEKLAAEEARREAEVANRAKTQFFSAASHDLRQPLHAMGLFAEALRSKAQNDEVAQLVNSINASVDALESLFSELLDITRIDSGGVAGQPAVVRGRRHLAQAAPALRADGVREGVWRCGCAAAVTWFMLIRCWSSGSCATWCRMRSVIPSTAPCWSARAGVANRSCCRSGIPGGASPPAEQQHIFEEFYQIEPADSRRPCRDAVRPSNARAWVSAWRLSSDCPN